MLSSEGEGEDKINVEVFLAKIDIKDRRAGCKEILLAIAPTRHHPQIITKIPFQGATELAELDETGCGDEILIGYSYDRPTRNIFHVDPVGMAAPNTKDDDSVEFVNRDNRREPPQLIKLVAVLAIAKFPKVV